jgi:hypothetical protein
MNAKNLDIKIDFMKRTSNILPINEEPAVLPLQPKPYSMVCSNIEI